MCLCKKKKKENLEYSPFMKDTKITEDIYFKQIRRKGENLQKVLFQKGQLPLWTESWIKNPVFRFKPVMKHTYWLIPATRRDLVL